MIRLLVILPLLVAFSQAQADTDGSYLDLFQGSAVEQRSFYASLYTARYDPDPDHNNNQQMLGLEIELRGNFKLTGGLLHGYKEPYDDKIPLNNLGVAPAAIPALGYHQKSFFVEFVQLGFSAGMINIGRTF
jgi:hypothetical protein